MTERGSNVVIGVISAAEKNIPDNASAFGNPCRPYREST